MAEMTIRLIPDPATGKKISVIALRSDATPCRTSMSRCTGTLVRNWQRRTVKAEKVGQITVDAREKRAGRASWYGAEPERKGAQTGSYSKDVTQRRKGAKNCGGRGL